MLKGLKLVGFKSFAEETLFEFPRGITIVVGPNGSGKSNVVDAVKWALGEQSIKSLRGKEMEDVIFNGSASRKPANSATATLIFDNAAGKLAIDTPEVEVTRRVYRGGDAEYLLNRQPCRLRDIRDLFAGTGVATQAYSVIEQGKVDILLQSSPRDRRVIFEEAAGISRFKAKKLETQRRLDRVDQNLLRLSDIVQELDSRLRSVRAQASRARRHREMSTRLQELRTQTGLADWREGTREWEAVQSRLRQLADEAASLRERAEASEARSIELDIEIGEADREIRASEARSAQNRERIAACETTAEEGRAWHREMEAEIAERRRQTARLSMRIQDMAAQFQQATDHLQIAEREHEEAVSEVERRAARHAEIDQRLQAAQSRQQQHREARIEVLRETARQEQEIAGLQSQQTQIAESRQRSGTRLAELQAARAELDQELAAAQAAQQEAETRCQQARQAATECERRMSELQALQERQLAERHELQQRLSRATERATVLQELEQRREGVDAGVKAVLKQAAEEAESPFRGVRGLVADAFRVPWEKAPLVELALGEKASWLVAESGTPLLNHLSLESPIAPGRVSFLWLPVQAPDALADDLRTQPGVVARADEWVETDPPFEHLAATLLGTTWIVEKFAHALALSERFPDRYQFVTKAGTLLRADGSFAVGTPAVSAGLISRRSELRELGRQIEELEQRQRNHEAELETLRQELETQRDRSRDSQTELQAATDELRQRTTLAERLSERIAESTAQETRLAQDLAVWEEAEQRLGTELSVARGKLAERESRSRELEQEAERLQQEVDASEAARQQENQHLVTARVRLANCEQRLAEAQSRVARFQADRDERRQAARTGRKQLEDYLEKRTAAERRILRAEAELALLFLRKEAFARDAHDFLAEREALRSQRSEHLEEARRLREAGRERESQAHALRLEASEADHQRQAIAERLREDYGLDLPKLAESEPPPEIEDRATLDGEIRELRRKLNQLGGVDPESLEELESLEERHAQLTSQWEDLSEAKKSLEEIIQRINADTERLFLETLETVKSHFQILFRKLFGGGRADIVLEDEEDILESGIEIVAQPPGKELRSISLLSGGEKTLTCVALLLAVFRGRPSPFCILDEVDAALDEANIERFIGVLQEFLSWTQFIVITHSKRTMVAAHTLYGVTMEESGVSKRVSVRFEDVRENGEIVIREPGQPSSKPAAKDSEAA